MPPRIRSATTAARRGVFAACVAAVLALPLRADAQQAAFFQALTDVTAAIEGTFGDEGARVQPALDTLAAALAAWDRELDAAAASLRATLPTAGPSTIVDRRITLGRQYANRGRLADALSEFAAAVALDPRRVDAHVLRGLALREAGRTAEAIAALRAGEIGDVRLAVCYSWRRRPPIGGASLATWPGTLNADLWFGPRPIVPPARESFHYDWHWFYEYGNGGLGNNGVHRLDVARWGLQLSGTPTTTLSLAGRLGPKTAARHPTRP